MDGELRLNVTQQAQLSQQALLAVRLLVMSNSSLAEYSLEQSEKNPALEYLEPKRTGFPIFLKQSFNSVKSSPSEWIESLPHPEHFSVPLAEQLNFVALSEAKLKAARVIIDALSPDGYLRGPIEDIAHHAGVSMHDAIGGLHAVQSLDPPGVGARSLSECLTLQLSRMGEADELAYAIARDYLPEVGERRYSDIAAALNASVARVRKCCQTLRSLAPRPLNSHVETVYITPDLSILPAPEGGLMISYFDDYYPMLRLDPGFSGLMKSMSADDKRFARQTLKDARRVVRAIEMRRDTLDALVRFIADTQRGFLLEGLPLLPLRYRDAALEMNVHETTVYRAARNKYVLCSSGTYPMSHFFQRELPGGGSVEVARTAIRRLCAENPSLSDSDISKMLAEQGISIARRTVNKYRRDMGISSSFTRSRPE